jgi:Family of unknown function (DUF6320)
MRRCDDCGVTIEGEWTRCPLCGTEVTGEPVAGPFPAVPLRYSRRRVLRVLFLISLVVIVGSFLAQPLFTPGVPGLGVLRSLWLGVAAMWLVVMMAVRKRHNPAKGAVYLVVLVGLVSVYWDNLLGWSGWSLTYVVPIVCGASILAVVIIERAMRLDVGEHIVYSGLTVVLGLTPLVFLMAGWATTPLPSVICAALSLVALGLLQLTEVGHELAKRLHI